MSGFSTLSVGGTIVSPLRLNYDLTVTGSSTVALAYSNAGITDIVGLQVVIYNNSGSAITLTAGTMFNNYTAYPNYCSVLNQVVVPAFQTITLITTLIGQDYTISSISGKVSIDKGAAGNIVYQTAANRTGFLAAGTPNYVLESGGPGQPPYWNLLQVGSLSGGVAGSLVYQTGTSATAKSAVGTTFNGAGGGMAGMTSATTAGWIQTNLGQGLSQSNFSGGTLTFQAARSWTFNCTAINSGGSGNLYTYLNANNVPQIDGNTYTIYNDNTINFVLTIQNIENPNSWSNSLITSFTGGANQITLYPHESITFQQYNSNFLTILQTSQCLQLAASYTFVQPANNAGSAVFNLTANFDPEGWLTSSFQIKPKKPGNYLVCVQYSNSNALNASLNFSVQKNSGSTSLLAPVQFPYVANSQFTNNGFVVVNVNGTTDYINIYRTATFNSNTWIGGTANNVSVFYLNT